MSVISPAPRLISGDRKMIQRTDSFYLPEDGVYCAAKEAFPRLRRQEFRSQDGHKLVEINLSVT